MRNILIVDDEETLLLILKMESRLDEYKNQFNVITAQNGKEAVKILESNVIDFVVTDLKMPEMDGIEREAARENGHFASIGQASGLQDTGSYHRRVGAFPRGWGAKRHIGL